MEWIRYGVFKPYWEFNLSRAKERDRSTVLQFLMKFGAKFKDVKANIINWGITYIDLELRDLLAEKIWLRIQISLYAKTNFITAVFLASHGRPKMKQLNRDYRKV